MTPLRRRKQELASRTRFVLALLNTTLAASGLGAEQIAHWDFDEGAGRTVHDLGGLYDGTLYNSALDGSEWVEGVIGLALELDGVDDYVSHPLALPTQQGTLAHWLMPYDQELRVALYESDYPNGNTFYNGFGGSASALENHSGSADSWRFYYQDGSGGASNTQGRWSVAGGEVVPFEWTHVAATWDRAGDLVLYVDCVEVDRQSLTGAAFANLAPTTMLFGRPNQGGRYWKGRIDELRIYDHVLSANEVHDGFCAIEPDVSNFRGPQPVRNPRRTDVPAGFGSFLAAKQGRLAIGDPTVDAGNNGVVHLYTSDGDRKWIVESQLSPSQGPDQPELSDVAIDNDLVAISARGSSNPGRAWIFERSAGSWQQIAEIETPPGANPSNFGSAIVLSTPWLAVASPGVRGSTPVAGKVFVYQRNGTGGWNLHHTADDPSRDPSISQFAVTMDLAGGYLVVGSLDTDGSGRVHVYAQEDPLALFEIPHDGWAMNVALNGAGPSRCAGTTSPELTCLQLLVGTAWSASDLMAQGAATLYEFDAATGARNGTAQATLVTTIHAPAPDSWDYFGCGVGLYATQLVVTSCPNNHRGGAALWTRGGSTWNFTHHLRPRTWGRENEGYGGAVALDSRHIAVGAPYLEVPGQATGTVLTFLQPVFVDDFESGDTSVWSATTP
jgi:hypothetical protein